MGNVDHWSTQGQNIWTTASEIAAGRYQLHHDKLGTELAKDPSPVYRASGGIYPNSTNYWFRVTSYNGAGESPLSSEVTPRIPNQESSYLGMEDYWASFDVPGGKVNAFNGNLILEEEDFDLDGRGPGISISRTYNSQDPDAGILGKGWTSSLDVKVKEETSGDILLISEDKSIQRFKKVNNVYQAPLGVYLELTKDTNGYYLKDKDQTVTEFDTTGNLMYEKDANGNQTTFNYTNGKITSITDASGRTVSLAYNGDGYLYTINYENRVKTYNYDNGYLKSVKTPRDSIYDYGYENGKLRFVYDPEHTPTNPSFTEYIYVGDKLDKVLDVLQKQTSISYNPASREVTVTDPKGFKDVYSYNAAGNPNKMVVDADNLKLTTTYEYQSNNLVKTIHPKDQGTSTVSESYIYDKNGNVTKATDGEGASETYAYNTNNDVIKATDTENHTTTVAYDNVDAVSETNQSGQTASVTHYDQFGNVMEESEELAPSYNTTLNPSFENGLDTNWIKSTSRDTGSTSVIDLNTITTISKPSGRFWGNKVLKIDSQRAIDAVSTQHGYIAATQTINVKPNQTYTLSGIIKGEGLEKAHAFFNVQYLNAQGQGIGWRANRYGKLTGTTKWTERQLSFATTNDTVKVKIYLEVEHFDTGVKGSALFDMIQLEEGAVSSTYNPVNNSSFEQNPTTTTGWSKSVSTAITGIGEGFNGNQGVYIDRKSTTDATVLYFQDIILNQSTPRDITVTGMSKAENVKHSSGQSLNTDYSVWADVTFTDSTMKAFQAKFPTGTHDWNRSAVTINAKELDKSIQKVRVYLIFRNGNTGKAYFDDIRLIEDNVLSLNVYDTKNNYVEDSYDEKGNKTHTTYDVYGNKDIETDPNGYQKDFDYYQDDLLKKVTLPNQTSVSYEYDKNGNNTKKTITAPDGKFQTIQYQYYPNDKLKFYIDPFGYQTSHFYDGNGNSNKTIKADTHVLEWTHDGANRVKDVIRDGNVAFTYEYDANGNEKKVTDSVNSIVRDKNYDITNRITSMTDRGGTVSWGYYEKTGKVKDIAFSQQGVTNKISYVYNVLNQNTEVSDDNGTPASTSDDKNYYFDFDEHGNVRMYTAGNGAGSAFNYDITGKVTNLYVGTQDNTVILSESYGYDKNGNRTSITHYNADGTENGKTLNEYDSINQLKKETLVDGTVKVYDYDDFGNRKSVTINGGQPIIAEFNNGNQLESFGNESIVYDKRMATDYPTESLFTVGMQRIN